MWTASIPQRVCSPLLATRVGAGTTRVGVDRLQLEWQRCRQPNPMAAILMNYKWTRLDDYIRHFPAHLGRLDIPSLCKLQGAMDE